MNTCEEARDHYFSNTDLFELMVTTDDNRNNGIKTIELDNKTDTLNQYIDEYANTKLDPFEVDALKQFRDNVTEAEKVKSDI